MPTGKPMGKIVLGRHGHRLEENVTMDLKEISKMSFETSWNSPSFSKARIVSLTKHIVFQLLCYSTIPDL